MGHEEISLKNLVPLEIWKLSECLWNYITVNDLVAGSSPARINNSVAQFGRAGCFTKPCRLIS